MMVGSFLIVTLCLLLVIVIQCFSKKDFQKLKKIKKNVKTYRVRRSLSIYKENTILNYTNREDEWSRIDLPIDAREEMQDDSRFNFEKNQDRNFFNPMYNSDFNPKIFDYHYNSYHSVLDSDQWTEV